MTKLCTLSKISFGGPLGGPVGFGGPLGIRPGVAAGRLEPRGRRLTAGALELKASVRPQGAPMWPKATHGGLWPLVKRACPPRRGLEGEPRSGSNF